VAGEIAGAADAGQPVALGIQGMEERAGAIGGRLQIQSEGGHGTRVRLSIPLMRLSAEVAGGGREPGPSEQPAPAAAVEDQA
jgi:signal transduction histidine kinase